MIFTVKRQFWQLLGTTVRTYDENGQFVCLAHAKAFKLKEQITFFTDESRTTPLFSISARSVIDIGATYDITDDNGQRLGSLRRKGLRSTFIRDEWLLFDSQEQPIGGITEDTTGLGLLRRYIDFVSLFIPQRFSVRIGEREAGSLQQNKNPFTVRLQCTYEDAAVQILDKRLLIAIPNLLAVIEARQG